MGKECPQMVLFYIQRHPVKCEPKYSISSFINFMVRILLARVFASSMVASRMSHIALDLWAHIFGTILSLFSASSITSLLMLIKILAFTSIDRPIGLCSKDSRKSKQLIPRYEIFINFLLSLVVPGPFFSLHCSCR